MYLYDTNIIGELIKKRCNPRVKNFVEEVNKSNQDAYLSVVTIGEFEKGIEKLRLRNDHQQAQYLQNWYDSLLPNITKSFLPFTEDCAEVWGKLIAKNPHNAVDKQLVATALVHDLILVTCNVKDVENTDVRFINPFE